MIFGNIVRKSASATGRTIGRVAGGTIRHTGAGAANLRRRLLKQRLPEYLTITLDDEIVERMPITSWWHDYVPGFTTPASIEGLNIALRRIAGDPDVKGVVFLVKSPSLSLAQAQSMASLFARFQAWDVEYNGQVTKEITVYLEQVSAATAVMASAADLVVTSPLTGWDVLGLRAAPTFLKGTLAKLGIEFDVIKIAPWKTAADNLTRETMSDEQRDQYSWLLDSLYEGIVTDISQGRKLDAEVVRSLIDQAPLSADRALEAGLIDEIAYEDDLPTLLSASEEPAAFKSYGKAHKLLKHHAERPADKAIGVISLTGSIMTGKSRSFPVPLPIFGDSTIGSATAQQQIRAARKDESLGAVILHVDSGGGSALASDLIWRELKLLNQEKPLVVYMGDVAASGGYYIATPGRSIVAQRSTITGSIGVITAKPVTAGTMEKIGAKTEVVQRGEHAGIYSDAQRWTDDERATVEESVQHIYGAFKERVAESRGLEYDGLDEICNGRVWTGEQAQEHDLIDQVGDFQVAVELARELAELDADARIQTVAIAPPKKSLLAAPVEAAQAFLGLSHLSNIDELLASLTDGNLTQTLLKERFWLLADNLPEIK